ncbi:MAG: metallophosphoesterase family protein [Patescibacteria group bacterium]
MTPASSPLLARAGVNTMMISDVHLGSHVSRAKDLLVELKKYDYRRLILLGDVFDNLNFKRLTKDHWALLSYIRDLSEPENNVEVIWVLGNHDTPLENFSHFIDANAVSEYLWEHCGVKHLAIHGHQFDSFLRRNKFISGIASWAFLTVQRVSGVDQRLARFLKRLSKGWLRLSKQIARKAIERAESKGASIVFCGHTHKSMTETAGGIRYFNTGSSTDIPGYYITIGNAGEITIHSY